MQASGYRTKSSTGHHWVTLLLIPEFMDQSQKTRSDYFNACRAKRNITDYDRAGEISEADFEELLNEVFEFKRDVINWMNKFHKHLLSANITF